jgi:RNA polymerase sigma-70 factor (ECF subfamily)
MDAPRRKAIHEAMVRLADGDRSAFDVLLDELWPVILSLARVRGVAQEADAEDVAQDVFLKICGRITDFDRTRDGLGWAFGIASYEILTHRRRRQRRREVGGEAPLAVAVDPAASGEELLLHGELVAALEQTIGALSDDDRRALGLLPPEDGGGAVPPATLRKRRQRALDRLRILWRSTHGEP